MSSAWRTPDIDTFDNEELTRREAAVLASESPRPVGANDRYDEPLPQIVTLEDVMRDGARRLA